MRPRPPVLLLSRVRWPRRLTRTPRGNECERCAPYGTGFSNAIEPTEPPKQAERMETPPATRFGKPVPELAQTDLCLRALENLGGTATNKQIRDRLVRDGHDVDLDKVRSTLKYLSRKKPPPVQTDVGSGLWRLRHANMPAPFVPAGTLPMNGAGGES